MKRPPELYLLLLLHAMLGVSALAGGVLLILYPQGTALGIPVEWLEATYFSNYLIPGIILFVCNGLFPCFIVIGLYATPYWPWAQKLNIYSHKHWAWTYSLFSGIIVIIWILVQQLITHYFWLQPILTGLGLLIIIGTMLPRIMRFYTIPQEN